MNNGKYTILIPSEDCEEKIKEVCNIPGIEFDSAINMIKCFIAGKDYEDNDTGYDKPYEEFYFMNELLPAQTPKESEYSWAYNS